MKDDPERLTTLVNRLLTPLSDAVLKQGGTIDKYIGDCLMAFWNAPLDDPDHAVHAVRAALDMLAALARVNEELETEAKRERRPAQTLRIGIGINTGECVVGNMGSHQRFDYSALGDAVNLASRLEGASKDYGISLLLGEETARLVEKTSRLRNSTASPSRGAAPCPLSSQSPSAPRRKRSIATGPSCKPNMTARCRCRTEFSTS